MSASNFGAARLGSAREVLQIGAPIGREFSYELIATAAGLPDAVLQDALARLTEAELLLMRGSSDVGGAIGGPDVGS